MSAISWAPLESFTVPASASTASSGDDWFRSFLSSVALGLQPSFLWPGSGSGSTGSAGVSNFGNARLSHATVSTQTFGDGFLRLNPAHVSLHHVGSTWTGLLSHSAMVDHDGGVGASPLRGRWLTQSGSFSLVSGTVGSFGTSNVTFTVPYIATPPFVNLSIDTTIGYIVNLSSVRTTGFIATYSGLRGAIAITNVAWESDGTV